MAYETLIVEIEDHVCLIKLNRPDALNALNTKMLAELCDALEGADKNDKVRCIIVTGSEKAFAAGADIKEMSGKSFVDVYTENLFANSSDRMMGIRKPIIAAVSGYALGGGCELAMACDFIIASRHRQVRPAGNQPRRDRRHGRQPAPDALRWQVQGDGHEPDRPLHGCRRGRARRAGQPRGARQEADGRGARRGREDRGKSLISTKAAKEAVNRSYEVTLSEGLRFERRLFHSLFATQDQKEGMSAFLEKREAQFRDK